MDPDSVLLALCKHRGRARPARGMRFTFRPRHTTKTSRQKKRERRSDKTPRPGRLLGRGAVGQGLRLFLFGFEYFFEQLFRTFLLAAGTRQAKKQ